MVSYKSDIAARVRIVDAPGDWLDTSPPRMDFDGYRATVERAADIAREHRATVRSVYRSQLPDSIRLPTGDWRFSIRVPDRDRLIAALFDAGLFASTHYAPLTGIFTGGEAPVTEALHAEVVNLFDDRRFTVEQAGQACELILRHLG